jgi:hypothetical protein
LREQETDNNTKERHATEDRIEPSTSSVSATFSVPTSDNWLAMVATFKPSVTTGASGTTTATTTKSYAYDNAGNLVTQGPTTHTYSYRDRLVKSTLATSSLYYAYDHTNARVYAATTTATPTYFINALYETTGSKKEKHIYVNGTLVGTIETVGTTVTPYSNLPDPLLQSATLITNGSGSIVESLDYTPFGRIRVDQRTTPFSESRKYIGQVYDQPTELQYLNARPLKTALNQAQAV